MSDDQETESVKTVAVKYRSTVMIPNEEGGVRTAHLFDRVEKIMKILAIDSSGLVATVALLEDNNLVAEYTIHHKKTHSQTLMPMLDEIKQMVELDLSTVDAIAVASGPGSFTGLRIGAATAKGLAMGLGKPIIEVPTLEGIAYQMYGAAAIICPIMDARRNQVYTGLYQFAEKDTGYQMETLKEGCACDIMECIEAVNSFEQPVVFLGDGVPVFEELIREHARVPVCFAPAHRRLQSAASVGALAMEFAGKCRFVEAKDHAPEYFRMSQAERERMEAKQAL